MIANFFKDKANFFRGMLSLELFPPQKKPNLKNLKFSSNISSPRYINFLDNKDFNSFQSDWEMVGKDLNNAIQKIYIVYEGKCEAHHLKEEIEICATKRSPNGLQSK